MKLGVFDSGIGGEAIAAALRQDFQSAEIMTANDRAHLPYGAKQPEEICRLTDAAIQPLLKAGCDVIVIACNSATTAAIDWLRKTYPDQLFIGIEPMLKPAASLTKTGVVAVCATPATLASRRYQIAKETHAREIIVLEPDCHAWASLIETNAMNSALIEAVVADVLAKHADVIVLGCTHYHWIKQEISSAAGPGITVLEPSEAISRRVAQLLSNR